MNKRFILWALPVLLWLCGCKREWDNHNAITDEAIGANVFVRIQQDSSLRAFSDLLVKTGFDSILASSRAFTVWAPVNESIRQVDAGILNNDSLLQLFVASHISYQSYLTGEANPLLRLRTLSGKYYDFTTTHFAGATIVKPNGYARNGIVHSILGTALPRPGIWDYVQAEAIETLQRNYLLSLNYTDTDSATGQPVVLNPLLENVADVSNEAKQYTFFLLTDAAYTDAVTALKPYFVTGTVDSTEALAAWALVKDLTVEGYYSLAALPDTLVSTTGVKIPIDKNAIVRSYTASNGIVYVLNKPASRLQDKFKPVIAQGEAPTNFSRTDKAANIFYRIKSDPAGNVFRDIQVYGHATPLFYIRYDLPAVPSGTYKVYWRAVAGNQDAQTVAFQQRLAFGAPESTSLAYSTVPLLQYNEVLVGTYTVTRYGSLPVFLVAANSGTAGVNTLSLDYLKLELSF